MTELILKINIEDDEIVSLSANDFLMKVNKIIDYARDKSKSPFIVKEIIRNDINT